jgi:hypothetical protein
MRLAREDERVSAAPATAVIDSRDKDRYRLRWRANGKRHTETLVMGLKARTTSIRLHPVIMKRESMRPAHQQAAV